MKLYCIGVGPGNPELLTCEALKILNRADIIFSGQSAQSGYKIAENSIFHLIRDKKIISFEYARRQDNDTKKHWEETADMILNETHNLKTAAIITTGDPTIFSSFMIIKNMLESKGVETEIINGVTSITATAKALGTSLLMKDEALIVISGTHPHRTKQYKTLLSMGNTVIFLKGLRGLRKLTFEDPEVANLQAAFIKNASMANEEVYRGTLKEIFDNFYVGRATIMVKKSWQQNNLITLN